MTVPARIVTPLGRPAIRLGWLLLLLCLGAAIVNAWLYAREVAIPVISTDAWYFLDVFVSKDVQGTLEWRDFFIKRDTSDHAQPLHRLQLMANTHWFDMDFTVEALIGICGLLISLLLLLRWIAGQRGAASMRWGDFCLLALLPLALVSLNSREIYSWSLVTLFYIALPFMLLNMIVVSRVLSDRAPRWWWVFFSTFLCLVVLDGAGVLTCVALLAALLLEVGRGAPWRRAATCAAAIASALLLYKLGYYLLLPAVPTAIGGSVSELLALLDSGIWRWFIYPASASVAHVDHLRELFGSEAVLAQVLVGIAVLLLHALFWWSVFRGPRSRLSFVAVSLMLVTYGMTAGIILSRVPHFGAEYLLQHRYVLFYQLAHLALLVQWLSVRWQGAADAALLSSRPATTSTWRDGLPLLALVAVAAWQIHLARTAWAQAVYVKQYGHDMAQAVFCLGEHPRIEGPPVCVPNHSVCGWSEPTRNRLVRVLREHQLNVYSPGFQRRYDMAPDPARSTMCLPRAAQ